MHTRISRRSWLIVAAVGTVVSLLLATKFAADFVPAQISHETILVDRDDRQFRLVVPNSVAHQKDLPVVFALHGALDTTDQMADYTQLDHTACEHGFLLVYLQGRHLNWPPSIPPENPDYIIPDLRFFETMCDLVVDRHSADPERIYVVGVSQGGAMATVLTAKCSDHIAASVCNCGWLPDPLGDTPLATAHKCPMLFISGTNDTQVRSETTRAAHDAFERDGHPVSFRSLAGRGHGWNEANETVWAFLREQRRSANQNVE
ncbi:MAG: dienelactone hydrolase family protein [Planctomycetales bacterium]|nr:dienelactone hydrolase family protein [Planctomycetales bacterium]